MRLWALLPLFGSVLASAGCRSVSYVGDGEGGSTSTSSTSGTAGSGGCSADSDCDDDNPCTDDRCTEGACSYASRSTPAPLDGNPCTIDACNAGDFAPVPIAPGEPGRSEEGGCPDGGVCQTDAACGLSLYSRPFPVNDGSVPWERVALSVAWSGAGAPPPRGIVAAEHSYAAERLYVFDAEGRAYLRASDVWSGPAPVEDFFSGLPPTEIASLVAWLPQDGNPETFVFYTRGPTRRAHYFDVTATGAVVGPVVDLEDDPTDPSSAPHASADTSWGFAYQTAFIGTPSWVVFYTQVGPNLFLFDGGDATWQALGLDVETSVWGGASTGGPATQSVVAAYFHDGRVHLVAP